MRAPAALMVLALACVGCDRASQAAPPQSIADGVRAVCAGQTPEHADARALAAQLDDAAQPKALRILALRDSAREAGVADCARLVQMTTPRSPPPERPPPIRIVKLEAPSVDFALRDGNAAVEDALGRAFGSAGKLGGAAPGRAKVVLGEPGVTGGLSASMVLRIARRNFGKLRACHEKTLGAAPDTAGRVELAFTVAPDGAVGAPTLKTSTLGHAALEACIVEGAARWRFPPTPDGRAAEVVLPLSFAVR